MVDWFRIFRRPTEPDYESLLSQLEIQIKARESQLLAIRLRERRANALFITYGVGAWIVYLGLWWLGVVGGKYGLERVLGGLPVIGGPVAIIFTRRVLRYIYKRQEDKETKTLAELKKEQRDKVEELKKKTGYYSTRNLLEKYDEAIKKNAEARGHSSPNMKSNVNSIASSPSPNPLTPSRPGHGQQIRGPNGTPMTINRSQPPFGTPQSQSQLIPQSSKSLLQPPSSSSQQSQSQHQPQIFPLLPPAASTTVPRTLIDKLADALLGVIPSDDTSSGGAGNNKYALICAKCFGHNGLVVKEEFDFIQYQCPRCGHFNPRRSAPTLRARTTSMQHLNLPPQTPDSSGHRRVKSLHVSSNLREADMDQDENENEMGGKDGELEEEVEVEVEVDEVDEVDEVILKENKSNAVASSSSSSSTNEAGSKPRRRRKKNENDMDTD